MNTLYKNPLTNKRKIKNISKEEEEDPIRYALRLAHYKMEEIATIADALTSLNEGNEELFTNFHNSHPS